MKYEVKGRTLPLCKRLSSFFNGVGGDFQVFWKGSIRVLMLLSLLCLFVLFLLSLL